MIHTAGVLTAVPGKQHGTDFDFPTNCQKEKRSWMLFLRHKICTYIFRKFRSNAAGSACPRVLATAAAHFTKTANSLPHSELV